MKEVTVNCLGFLYTCIRGAAPSPFLIRAVSEFLAGEKRLVIFNDAPSIRVETIVNDLQLSGKQNVLVCSIVTGEWQLYDAGSNSLPLTPRPASLGDALGAIQRSLGLSAESTVTVGASAAHLPLKEYATLHFHVGSIESLTGRVRGLIPLTDQYEFGLTNVLGHFSQNHSDLAIQCEDLTRFVASSEEFFRRKDAGSILAEKHFTASQELANTFPDDIVAIFGTGFPFYLSADSPRGIEAETPASILKYFDVQFRYFGKKLIDEKTYNEHSRKVLSVEEMAVVYGIDVLRNDFDKYLYEQKDYSAPADVAGEMAVSEYYAETCFDVASDVWPCSYCVPLQSEHRHPHQATLKYTNFTCLPCKQTSLKLRNVMACTPDIDVVVVVRKDKSVLAEKINRYILNRSSFYLYDNDFYRTLVENDGPVDLFVTEADDLNRGLAELVREDWETVIFDAIALWSPSVKVDAQLGLSFPLAFEPVVMKDDELLRNLLQARREFAGRFSAGEVAARIRQASFYGVQLMSNASVVNVIEKRLQRWRE
jgi:hypothetical protein